MSMFMQHTPIEEYKIENTIVYVKRDDMYGQFPMPPLAKLRGIRIVVEKLYNQGVRNIGVMDTRVSKSGQGVAALCKFYYPDVTVHLGFPVTKENKRVPEQHEEAERQGARLYPIQATRQSIMWYKFRNMLGYDSVVLPHGLPFTETANAVAKEAETVPVELLKGSLVLIVGTGTMLSGILAGLKELPPKVVGISAGKARETQITIIKGIMMDTAPLAMYKFGAVELLDPVMPYHMPDRLDCPFPSHPNYDRKAWHWMCDHIDELPKPILFWNIGA